MTLVPVPTKMARSHSDIKGRRPFDVPASIYHFSEWRPAKPSTGMSLFSNNFQTTVRFSQSDFYRCRQDGTVFVLHQNSAARILR